MNNKTFRQTLINLLDDEHGVNEIGFRSLVELAKENNVPTEDIFGVIEMGSGRVYLPEDHGLVG